MLTIIKLVNELNFVCLTYLKHFKTINTGEYLKNNYIKIGFI